MTTKKEKTGETRKRKTLADAVPDIDMYWDYVNNEGKAPSDFAQSAADKAWTFCPICKTPVRRNVRFTWKADKNGVGHVIHCRTCGKRNDDNSLIRCFPGITDYWVNGKNEHDPDFYTVVSGKKAYLNCPDCGKERYLAISDAVAKDKDGHFYLTSCMDCAKAKTTKKRRQDGNIVKCCPDIYKYWDGSNECDPKDLTVNASNKIITICPECGKPVKRWATNSFKKENGIFKVRPCRRCVTSKANYHKGLRQNGPVIAECPEIDEWWDYLENDVKPDMVSRGSHFEAFLKCPACHAGFRRDIHSFISVHRNGALLPVPCPKCGYSSKGDPTDNIVVECPDITRWWHYEKNAPFKPEQFTKGSQFRAYLTCPDCGLELYTGIHSLLHTNEQGEVVVSHDGRCRKYRARKSENNILALYPEANDWWDYERNRDSLPQDFTVFSPLKAYFKCPDCSAETHRRISDAFLAGNDGVPVLFKCPYCANKKVLPGFRTMPSSSWQARIRLEVRLES